VIHRYPTSLHVCFHRTVAQGKGHGPGDTHIP
jgi:hypothetical protein